LQLTIRNHPRQFVFTHSKDNRHYTTDCLNRRYRKYLKLFNEKNGTDLDIPLYEFSKHSFGTQFINKYPELEGVLQEHYGHTNPKMT
jgi:hypothetical protein